jgi:lipopolysaccharide transport system ATP-binding protein
MSDTVIRVENLGKKYIIGHQQQERYTSLRDVITNRVKSLSNVIQNSKSKIQNSSEEFWALKDVSFEIKQGDRVGIIGRNGAGKSTLLKILSRITEPTQGSIKIKGRVASLLEVGTGFHPELTGRENIFLNGAILGMSKAEIQHKFDEIVAFAEIEKFLDTPVKRYSSGMYVRLAFAVAAHLEPEILIVDEVLAVGDAQFQKKCLGKMEDVGKEGRSIIFVSHDMGAIRQLCTSAILLNQGCLEAQCITDEVVHKYLIAGAHSFSKTEINHYGITLLSVALFDEKTGLKTNILFFNQSYTINIQIKSRNHYTNAGVVLRVYNANGSLVSSICSPEEGLTAFTLENTIEIIFSLPNLQLLPGQYTISVYIYRTLDSNTYLASEQAYSFEIQSQIVCNASCSYRRDHGIVRIANGGRITHLIEA